MLKFLIRIAGLEFIVEGVGQYEVAQAVEQLYPHAMPAQVMCLRAAT
jgi:hypothetical protein